MYAKPDGLAWCGTTEDWRGFDRQSLPETRDRILAGVKRILPAMADATVEMHTACLRPVTPDWLPILGQVKGYQNAWLATGAGKKGILLAPGIGKSAGGPDHQVRDGPLHTGLQPRAIRKLAWQLAVGG
jgi:glycine/D-amino acid oxidase-like deaminating enzyme